MRWADRGARPSITTTGWAYLSDICYSIVAFSRSGGRRYASLGDRHCASIPKPQSGAGTQQHKRSLRAAHSRFWYTKTMQKLATRVFICASVTFGILGILVVLTASGPDKPDSTVTEILIRLLFINVFIILPAFALSIAGKYLKGKS